MILFVQGLWLNLEKDQLFCLLGPNGAGKTTVISCLTGITPVTHGNGNSNPFEKFQVKLFSPLIENE